MTSQARLVTVGRVGRVHGLDGSFWVEDALEGERGGRDPLAVGTEVFLGERRARVERRGGTDTRPLLRLASVEDREAATALRGRELRVCEADTPLAAGEWLIADLVGARVEGIGEVRRVLSAPSCDLLEVGDEGVLIPLVSDAIRRIDVEAGRIEVDHAFLGVGEGDLVRDESSATAPSASSKAAPRP